MLIQTTSFKLWPWCGHISTSAYTSKTCPSYIPNKDGHGSRVRFVPLYSSCELNEIFESIDTQPTTCTKVIDALAEYPITKQDGRRFQRLRNGRLEAYMQDVRISRTLLITGIVISRPSVAECVVYHTRIETHSFSPLPVLLLI